MKKVIIKHSDSISYETALEHTLDVMSRGLVSVGRYGRQYCFFTTYKSDAVRAVQASKTKTGTHVFTVFAWDGFK